MSSTTISAFGSAAAPVAAIFTVRNAGGSASDVGMVGVAGLVPALAFFLVGGVIADRWPRNLVLIGASALSAVSQASLAFLVLTGQVGLGHVVAVSAANGFAMAFGMPAAQGLLMRGVDRENATRAFATFRLGLNLAQIGGAALGGTLVALVGPGWVLALDSLTFVVAIVLRLFMKIDGVIKGRGGLGGDLKDGWTELRSHRWLGPVLIQFAAVNALAVGAFELVLGPVRASEVLGGAAAWGAVLSSDAVGMVLGGLMMLRLNPARPIVWAIAGGALTVLPMGSMAAGAPLVVVCVAAAAGGIGVEVFGVNLMTMAQREIAPDKFSRVSAYQSIAGFGLTPVGTALAGPAAVAFGTRAALWAGSVLLLGIAGAVFLRAVFRAETVGAGCDDPRRS